MDLRVFPSTTAGDRQSLEEWLEFHRATLEMKCSGLSAEQLRMRSAPPSNLTLLGLMRHMARVEQGWFQEIFKGEKIEKLYRTPEARDNDFNDLEGATPEEVLATWREQCDIARRIAAEAELDDIATVPKERDPREQFSLRWIMVHMIEEYARHNGHADLLREAIDGAVGD